MAPRPMNWTNIMSSKGQVYAKKTVDFISKTEGPVYFEQVGILFAKPSPTCE